jgi:hypothetical protein
MTSGVATMTSASSQPSLSFCRYSMPTKSAPAASASRTRSPWVITSTRTDLPVPWGSTTVPRTTWSACRGSTPRRTATSTVSSNLANAAPFTIPTASGIGNSRVRSTFAAAAVNRLPWVAISR